MRKSKFIDNQIMDAVKRVEAGFALTDICRELGVSTADMGRSERFNRTIRYEWLSQY